MMRALVIYESMFGNTRQVAENIADGLSGRWQVAVIPVAEATPAIVTAADLLIVGGPTHMHGLPTAVTRRGAADAADKDGSGLVLEPGATGPGLREWPAAAGLAGTAGQGKLAAAFDTRMSGPAALTGRASRGIARILTRHGWRLVAE